MARDHRRDWSRMAHRHDLHSTTDSITERRSLLTIWRGASGAGGNHASGIHGHGRRDHWIGRPVAGLGGSNSSHGSCTGGGVRRKHSASWPPFHDCGRSTWVSAGVRRHRRRGRYWAYREPAGVSSLTAASGWPMPVGRRERCAAATETRATAPNPRRGNPKSCPLGANRHHSAPAASDTIRRVSSTQRVDGQPAGGGWRTFGKDIG